MMTPYYHCARLGSSGDELLIHRAQVWAHDGTTWRKIAIAAQMPWGRLQDWASEQAARARQTVKLVVLNPLSSAGEPQFFDVYPAFCLN